MPLPSYASLKVLCAKQERQIKELRDALAISKRALVGFGVDRWVSIPLPQKQLDAVRDVVEDRISQIYGDGERLVKHCDGYEVRRVILKADELNNPLAEYRAYLVDYAFAEDGSVSNVEKIWALIPV